MVKVLNLIVESLYLNLVESLVFNYVLDMHFGWRLTIKLAGVKAAN